MSLTRWWKGVTVVFAIVLVGTGSAFAPAAGQDVKKINVVIITPLTGTVLPIMEASHNSIKMALEEVSAKGIMLRGQKYVFEPHWFDDECTPRVGVSALRAALAKVSPVHIIWTPVCSTVAVGIRDVLLESGHVALNSTSATPRYAGPKGNPYLFKIKENADWRGQSEAWYLKAQGWKRVVVIQQNTDWGADIVKGFQKAAEATGVKILAALKFDKATQEFTPHLVQVRGLAPDALYVASQSIDEQIAFLRQYRQLGMTTPLMGPPTWTQEVAGRAGWDLMDGLVSTSAWVPTEDRPAVRTYVEKYKARFGHVPGFNGPPAYDMVYVTAKAFERAGSLEKEALRKALRETSFPGTVYAQGTVKFDDAGQAQFGLFLMRFDAKKHDVTIVPTK